MPNDAKQTTETVQRLALRPDEAAKSLGISARKLWEITADTSSRIPHIRFGRCVTYPIRELEEWLSARVKGNGVK